MSRLGRLAPEALDEAHRIAVRTSVLTGAVAGATAYALGALRGAGNYLPSIEFEWKGGALSRSSEQVVTKMELDADGNRRITRTTTTTANGERRVQTESLNGTSGPPPSSFLRGFPFPLPAFLDRNWSLPSSESFTGRALESVTGVASSAAWCALCTLPAARMEWRFSMFGSRALLLRQNPGLVGAFVGLRVLAASWLGGCVVAGTVGSGGIALLGIPAAMLAGLPVFVTGLVLFPFTHRAVALRLVRNCVL
ncbi:hypothetical protein T492DRAFT_946028 [Pavlovales sp. CCMP2436]|nr:hypothetical protein T492DRAFT_946028 [Pavlovales sp. CCMP2436]